MTPERTIPTMTTKKTFGYIFIVIAIILTLAAIIQLPKLFINILSFSKIFKGTLDPYHIGYVAGGFIFWILELIVIIALWIYGRRWIKIEENNVRVK